jgi:hypothetical protein
VRQEARALSEAEFVARHPAPALVLVLEAGREGPADARALLDAGRTDRLEPEVWITKTHDEDGVPPLEDLLDAAHTRPSESEPVELRSGAMGLVWVQKREGNPFRHMITIGRVPNNDITFAVPTLSKIHAYLRQDPSGAWWLYDQRSTNGTWVDGQRLARDGKAILRDGAWINLGPSLGVKFFQPGTLWAFLRDVERRARA